MAVVKLGNMMVYIWIMVAILAQLSTCEPRNTVNTRQTAMLSKTLPPEWDELCPYTDICEHNASRSITLTSKQKLCCSSCSCSADCGLTKSCCQYDMDKYRLYERYPSNCMYLTTVDTLVPTAYQTVDRCPNMTRCSDFVTVATWGSMYPVFSPITTNIYLNKQCAACHDEDEVVEWQIEVNCKSHPDQLIYLQTGLQKALHGDFNYCSFTFFPPPGYNVEEHFCSAHIISQCPNTNNSTASTEYAKLCDSFNATFIYNNFVYANVYCYLCLKENIVNQTRKDICEQHADRRTRNVPFSLLLSTEARTHLTVNKVETKKPAVAKYCEVDKFQERISRVCRKYRCPEGQFMIDEKCSFLTNEWTAGPFRAYIHLQPVGDKKFPFALLEELSKVKGKIFKTYMKEWSQTVYYSHKVNSSFVDYFVLDLFHNTARVNPSNFINKYKSSLNTVVTLKIKGVIYSFLSSVYDYYRFGWYNRIRHEDVISKGSSRKPYIYSRSYIYKIDELIYLLKDMKYYLYNRQSAIILRKMYTCLQVDLYPDEYIIKEGMLYLNRTKQYIKQVEYKVFYESHHNETVSVCAEEFGQDLRVNKASTMSNVDLIYIILILVINSFTELIYAMENFCGKCMLKYFDKRKHASSGVFPLSRYSVKI